MPRTLLMIGGCTDAGIYRNLRVSLNGTGRSFNFDRAGMPKECQIVGKRKAATTFSVRTKIRNYAI
ncbi:hypothetical protein EV129_104360 [Rhizobium azibense]|uniref:Uncharacterized protein n=1 Tax=Rhizobium azibense TaxID=1136135 RepID=A0A4R3RRU7_9HYPH|nr:hypothetical protein EV129_104360 [Rhizobium azibense]